MKGRKCITGLAIGLLATLTFFVTAPQASAWPNPGSNGCLGGTVVASSNVTNVGTLRIYRNCGSYHAYFTTGGVRRSLGIQLYSGYPVKYEAWRWMDGGYAVWTDMIPGACVWAQIYYQGQWMGFAHAQCGW